MKNIVLDPTRSLLLIALGHLTVELCSNFLPVVYPHLVSTLALSYAQVGLVTLVAGVGTSLAQPLFGLLSDRWDPKRISALSIAWNGLIMALVGLTGDYPSLVLVVGLGMLGSAAFHPSGATVASASAAKRRGAAVSVFSVGGNLGSALSPLWMAAAMGRLGLHGTLALIPVALPVSLFLHRRLARAARPEDNSGAAHQETGSKPSLAGVVLIVLAVTCRTWFQVAFTTYLPAWAQDQGRSLAAGGHMLSLLLACAGFGSLIGGALSDRIGRWQVLALSLALLGPAEWLFLTASGHLQMALLGLIGLSLGATFPVSIVLAQETWPRGLGVAAGLVLGLPWVGGGIGASLTGLVADRSSLTAGLRSLPLPAALGAGCILAYAALRPDRARD
jgi:FSR family fosmidomycin resistance protein-like MFS transporter